MALLRRRGHRPRPRPGAVGAVVATRRCGTRSTAPWRRSARWCSSCCSTSSCSACCPATRSRSTPAGATSTGRSIQALRAKLNTPLCEQFIELPQEPALVRGRLDPLQRPRLGGHRPARLADAAARRAPRRSSPPSIGVWLGIRSGWNRGGRFDKVSTTTTLVLYSMPEFWFGMIMLIVFSVARPFPGWFPIGGLIHAGRRSRDTRRLARRRLAPGAAGHDARRHLPRRVLADHARLAHRGDAARTTCRPRAPRASWTRWCAAATRCPTRCSPR